MMGAAGARSDGVTPLEGGRVPDLTEKSSERDVAPVRARKKKNPVSLATHGVSFGTLAVTYSSVATGKTTIGAERFHFRVRNGIGWFPLAIAARETCHDHRCRVLSHATSPAANPEVL